ncbi:hypothetical protein B0H34DRAFT_810448 [Crassisporium funariophilum]|nr:hypothetical protein B0H34DRAFT_810448 [Crassisporium funariophilum]
MGNPHSSSFNGEPALLTFEQRIQVNILIRLKKTYQAYCKQFQVTGGGVKEDEDAENLTDQINRLTIHFRQDSVQMPFYKDLHKMWSELPNYNPIGITTSNPGQDFAGNAEALFAKKSGETDTSSGIKDNTLSTYDDEYEGDVDDDGGSMTAARGIWTYRMQKKQEFKKEKFKAKLWKMELEAKRSEQQFKLFRMMISCGEGSSSQAQQGWALWIVCYLTSTSDAGLPSTSTSDVGWNFGPNDIPQVEVGDFTAELNKVQWPGNDANQNTGH